MGVVCIVKIVLTKKKVIFIIILFNVCLFSGLAIFGITNFIKNKPVLVMGANLQKEKMDNTKNTIKKSNFDKENYNEHYFRPAKLPSLNNKESINELINEFFDKNPSEIKLPSVLLRSPEQTIINFYSVLQQAENISEDKKAGCGTIGWAKIPYPIAYKFLTSGYQNKVSYKDFLNSFKDIAHINLIKLKEIEPNKHFVELETIEPSEVGNTYFGYYYGYVYTQNENGEFKISNIDLTGEDFLCAPYHGWRYKAEDYVDTVYGNWCKLIDKRLPTEKLGYVKNIYVKGKNGEDYKFQFFQLTNGTDIEVGQFIKDENNEWKPVKIDINKCLDGTR